MCLTNYSHCFNHLVRCSPACYIWANHAKEIQLPQMSLSLCLTCHFHRVPHATSTMLHMPLPQCPTCHLHHVPHATSTMSHMQLPPCPTSHFRCVCLIESHALVIFHSVQSLTWSSVMKPDKVQQVNIFLEVSQV